MTDVELHPVVTELSSAFVVKDVNASCVADACVRAQRVLDTTNICCARHAATCGSSHAGAGWRSTSATTS